MVLAQAAPVARPLWAPLMMGTVIPIRSADQDENDRGDNTVDDKDLARAASQGTPGAFEGLFHRHARKVRHLVFRLMPDDPDIDDIVQDTFIKAFQHLDTLDKQQSFAAWLMTIAANTTRNHLRRKSLLRRLGLLRNVAVSMDDIVSPSAPPDVRAELESIYRSLDKLPADARMVLILHVVDGQSLPDIAARLGLSHATVKRRLRQARKLLNQTPTQTGGNA